ncbi:response regulator transcription factor [Vibrio agarivorans]|uniref:response regulator transcription factor n=1 Tax=Vibrio agarivorans TaxID=153622 RepID=UPI00223265C3|nr:response regulator transcription factor [Vibrio agarivorans]
MRTRGDYARTLYFLCEDIKENHLHVNRIESQLRKTIYKTTPAGLTEEKPKHRNKIVIVDYRSRSLFLKELALLSVDIDNFDTVLINVTDRLSTDELLRYGNLKGLFYRHEPTENITQGLTEIINGQNWLPRKVTSQLLYYYRKNLKPKKPPIVVDLTASELQVLRHLADATNKEIADLLCVTEFTIKSHLQQIFRKLSVKNRSQAIAWADHYLLS